MMSKRHYYYLIAGLPELTPEQTKAPFSVTEFVEMLEESLHPDDLRLARLLFLPYEDALLLDLARGAQTPAHPLSRFSREELEERLKEPGQLPAYRYRFYDAFRNEEPLWADLSWENQLTRLRYEYLLEETEGFLHDWFAFELNLQNILVAWNSRHFELPLGGQLVGENEVSAALGRSHARDFGLANDHPYVDRLLNALEGDSILQCEKTIDHIKWDFIEASNTFHYFTLEVVLGYLLKLMMLERWLRLDAEAGRAAVDRWIRTLEKDALKLV